MPYTGIDSYVEGERTLFITLSDMTGVDTTSTGAPELWYTTDGGTNWDSTTYGLGSNNQFDANELVSIGTCASGCCILYVQGTNNALSFGDDFQYYWKFQDTNVNSATTPPTPDPNVGYEPALTGTQTTPTPYQVDIVDPLNAPSTSKKLTVLTTDATSSGYTNAPTNLDRQMTYYDESDEYFFEFDTSNCGTGTNACFFVGNNPFAS